MLVLVVAGIIVVGVAAYVGVAVHAARSELREKSEALLGAQGRDVLLGLPGGERRVRVLGLTDDGASVRLQEGRSETTVPLTVVRSFRRHGNDRLKSW